MLSACQDQFFITLPPGALKSLDSKVDTFALSSSCIFLFPLIRKERQERKRIGGGEKQRIKEWKVNTIERGEENKNWNVASTGWQE